MDQNINESFSGDCYVISGDFKKLTNFDNNPNILISDIFGNPIIETLYKKPKNTNQTYWTGSIEKKLVKDVKVGDYVLTKTSFGFEPSVVTHVLKTNITQLAKPIKMVCLNGGCKVTELFPVYDNFQKQWIHAKNSSNKVSDLDFYSDFLYNFILDSNHTLMISGTLCMTMAHNFIGPCLTDQYFGTNRIISDLNSLIDENNSGNITINDTYFHKNPLTLKIDKISKNKQIYKSNNKIKKLSVAFKKFINVVQKIKKIKLKNKFNLFQKNFNLSTK